MAPDYTLSSSPEGMAAQFKLTKGRLDRHDRSAGYELTLRENGKGKQGLYC
jgi:hypothetical protein